MKSNKISGLPQRGWGGNKSMITKKTVEKEGIRSVLSSCNIKKCMRCPRGLHHVPEHTRQWKRKQTCTWEVLVYLTPSEPFIQLQFMNTTCLTGTDYILIPLETQHTLPLPPTSLTDAYAKPSYAHEGKVAPVRQNPKGLEECNKIWFKHKIEHKLTSISTSHNFSLWTGKLILFASRKKNSYSLNWA